MAAPALVDSRPCRRIDRAPGAAPKRDGRSDDFLAACEAMGRKLKFLRELLLSWQRRRVLKSGSGTCAGTCGSIFDAPARSNR